MLVLNLQMEVQEGKKTKTVTQQLMLAVEVSDMTFRQWVDYHLLVQGWPEWLQEFARLSPADQHTASGSWRSGQQAEYWLEITKIVNNFLVKGTLENLFDLTLLEQGGKEQGQPDTASLEYLARVIFTNLAKYKPTARQKFTHRGHTYIVPQSEVAKVGQYEQITHLPNAKVGEVIEALQRAHIYGSKDEEGNYMLADRRYYTDLSMLACICRRQVGETEEELETIPFGQKEFGAFVDKRMKELESVSAAVAIDCSFFLLNSLRLSLRTGMSAWRSKNLKKPKHQRRQRQGRKGSKHSSKGGQRGGGTPRSTK